MSQKGPGESREWSNGGQAGSGNGAVMVDSIKCHPVIVGMDD